MDIKYPHIKVQLTGLDGNALSMIGTVRRALRSANVPHEAQKEFVDEAMSGDYDNVLITCMEWVNVT